MEFVVCEVALWQAYYSCFYFPLPVIIQWTFPNIDTSVASQERHVTWPLWRNFKPSPSTPGRSNFMANSDYRRKKQDTYARQRMFTVYLSVHDWYHSFCYFLLLNVQSNFSRRLSLHYITLTRNRFMSVVAAKPGDGISTFLSHFQNKESCRIATYVKQLAGCMRKSMWGLRQVYLVIGHYSKI
jgi:hypothetical protein